MIQRPVVVPRSLLPSVTTRRTRMGLIGSDTRLLVVTWSKLPTERPVSRMSRPVVLLSLVRAPAQPPQHAHFGSRSHTPSNRCLRFERRVAAPPARLALASSHQLLLSHPASGFPTGFSARHTAAAQGARVEGAARRTLRRPDRRRTALRRALAPCAACAGTREHDRRRGCRPPGRPAIAFRSRSKPTTRAEACSAGHALRARALCCPFPGDRPPSS